MKARITKRGQVTIPAVLRREMHLTRGQTIIWEKVSATECRIYVQPLAEMKRVKPDPVAALKFAAEHGLQTMSSAEWLRVLREGEK